MSALPEAYAWLNAPELAPLPRMVTEALEEFGVRETLGPADTPKIMEWARECGVAGYDADAIPWCGLFMALVARRAGKVVPAGPLWALNWAKFGEPGGQPELGDVLVFVRPGGGHVGLYIGEGATTYYVLGGNQSDSVCITQIEKTRLHAVRQPPYRAKPASARTYVLKGGSFVSVNEQ